MKSQSNRFQLLLLLFLLSFTLGLALIQAVTKPLWFDEIWSARIAFLPTWKAVFHATQTVDLNPPLDCLLEHLDRPLLGARELGARFPSMVGFTLAVGSLFWLLRLYVSPWFAASGALLLVVDRAVFYYATEARPYGLLLGFCGLSLFAYNALLASPRRAALLRVFLFVGTVGMLLSHIFSVLVVGALLLAEAVRALRTRRVDRFTWAALLLPLVCCVLYRPLFSTHAEIHYPPDMRPSLVSPLETYEHLLSPLAPVVIVGALALLLFVRLSRWPEKTFRESLGFRPEQYVLFGILLAMPVIITVLLLSTNPESGYFYRYGLVCLFPVSVLLTVWVAWLNLGLPAAGKVLFAVILLLSLRGNMKHPAAMLSAIRHGLRNSPEQFTSAGTVATMYPDLPLVAGDYQEFLEADDRLSSDVLHRFYYLADTPAALRLAHTGGNEYLIRLRELLGIRGNVALLPAFVAEHREFLVIGDQERSISWLIPWALEQHADVHYLGKQEFMGDDLQLWRVRLP